MRGLLILQVRVVAALVLRETRATFGRSQLGYLWAIVTPAASVAILVMIFSAAGRQAPFGSSLAAFFGVGIFTLEYFNRLSGSLMSTFDANKSLLTYPIIKATDALFARFILISVTYILIIALFFFGLIALDLARLPAYPERLMQAFVTTSSLGFGFGTVNAVLISKWDSWKYIERVLTRPLFFLSGIFYVPSQLPPDAIAVLSWNPILHVVEWMRSGYYSDYDSSVLHRTYAVGVATGLTLLALLCERMTRKKRAAS